MANDFSSLLSVFRDATSTTSSSAGVGGGGGDPLRQPSKVGAQSRTASSAADGKSSTGAGASIDPTSTTDPSFSAPLLKERIERLLRVRQIRQSTAASTSSKNDGNTEYHNGKKTSSSPSFHIALCATIVDDFPHETLWKKWMDETGGEFMIDDGDDPSSSSSAADMACKEAASVSDEKSKSTDNDKFIASAEMYVHAKNPERVASEWLRSKTLPITHRPNWNDVRIVRAILSLLESALKDSRTTHVLLCTESCIPVTTLKECARSILLDEICLWEEEEKTVEKTGIDDGNTKKSDNKEPQPKNISNNKRHQINWNRSYVDCYNRNNGRCTRFDEHNCWDILRNSIPSETIYKALPGWCLLSRKHAQSVLDLPSQQLGGMNLWPAFERVWAPEEVFLPTALALGGNMNEVDVSRRALTHSQWDARAANHKDRAHPLSYDGCFDDELVSRVRSDGCLFLRKMKRPLNVTIWEDIVVRHRRGSQDMAHSVLGQDATRRRIRDDIGGERYNYHPYHHNHNERDGRTHHSRTSYNSRRNYDSRRRRHNDDYYDRQRYDRGRADQPRHDGSWKRRRY